MPEGFAIGWLRMKTTLKDPSTEPGSHQVTVNDEGRPSWPRIKFTKQTTDPGGLCDEYMPALQS